MRKFVMIFVIMLTYSGTAGLANAQHSRDGIPEMTDGATRRKVGKIGEKMPQTESLRFFGQVVGRYNPDLQPEYVFESALDYDWWDGRLGGFAFFVVEESTSTAIGGGTVNLFPWLKVGVGAGYDQKPKALVGAGMLTIHGCHWEVRTYGWVGENDFYHYWLEGVVNTDYYVRFGATFEKDLGGGPWVGAKIADTPIELRVGAKWFSPFYSFEKEGGDPTYEATFRINLP